MKEKIQQDLKASLMQGEKLKVSILRMLLAAIITKEKEKRYKVSREKPELSQEDLQEEAQLSNEETIDVIASEVKKRKEASIEYEKGARPELAEKEKKEAEILQAYLPEQLPEEEIRKLVKEAIEKTGAQDVKDTGKVMAELMPKVKGKADGSQVSSIVRELLG